MCGGNEHVRDPGLREVSSYVAKLIDVLPSPSAPPCNCLFHLSCRSPELAALPIAQLLQRLPEVPEKVRSVIRNNVSAGVHGQAIPFDCVAVFDTNRPCVLYTIIVSISSHLLFALQGGGYVNHELFWNIMGPAAGGAPTGDVSDAINAAFGSFDSFKENFSAAAAVRIALNCVFTALNQSFLPDPTLTYVIAYLDGSSRQPIICRASLAPAGRGWWWTSLTATS